MDNAFDSQKHDDQEVLHVRAYGSSFFTLGINIRFSFISFSDTNMPMLFDFSTRILTI